MTTPLLMQNDVPYYHPFRVPSPGRNDCNHPEVGNYTPLDQGKKAVSQPDMQMMVSPSRSSLRLKASLKMGTKGLCPEAVLQGPMQQDPGLGSYPGLTSLPGRSQM